jgi:hypothetical protein
MPKSTLTVDVDPESGNPPVEDPAATGEPSPPSEEPIEGFQTDGELTSTVEVKEPSEATLKTGEEPTEGDPKPDEPAADVPFHEHPRWKEVMGENKTLREQVLHLTGKVDGIAAMGKTPGHDATAEGEELPFTDITTLSEEERNEWHNEDRLGYEANLARQIRHETVQDLMGVLGEKELGSSIELTFGQYEKDNSDFRSMWDSGEIGRYMDANPGHNAMSAHMNLTSEKRMEAAKEEGAELARKGISTKKSAATMGAGPSATGQPTKKDPRMKDPKKFGGTTNVLAQRLAERRESRGD